MTGNEEEVVEVLSETVDYTEDIQAVEEAVCTLQETVASMTTDLETTNEYLGYITGFLLFAVVVALCVFGYKFLRLFF